MASVAGSSFPAGEVAIEEEDGVGLVEIGLGMVVAGRGGEETIRWRA